MRSASSLFGGPVLPSLTQAALAITVLRSKPANITVRDYVHQLREHYKPGRRAENVENHTHYLDLVAYWQEQFRRAQEECGRLQSINIRLERSNQQLSQRPSPSHDERPSTASCDRPSTASHASKRRAASPMRTVKRPRASPSRTSVQSVAQTQEGIENDYEFLEGLGDDGAALIEALYSTHQLCRSSSLNAEALCGQLVRTSSALAKIIHLVAQNHGHLSRQGRRTPGAQSLDADRSDFSHALTISARAFMSVLVGITKMTDTSSDERLSSLVVCELAATFKAALLAIEAAAHYTADAASAIPPPSTKGKGKATISVPKESIPARSLAHLLIGLLGLLEKTNIIHQKVFDGFAFLLLEQVGKRLYYCTFGRHRSSNIEDELTPLPESSNPDDRSKQDCEALGTRLELKALILILERAMGLAPHHMNPATSKATKSPDSNRLRRTLSMKTLPAAPKGRLSPLAKDRLQRTLVACMYGNKQDDEFLDVLTKPVPAMRVGNLSNVAKIDDNDVEQWYKEEVWRLVGWDIMARETGF